MAAWDRVRAEINALVVAAGQDVETFCVGVTSAIDEGLEQHGLDLDSDRWAFWSVASPADAAQLAEECQSRGMSPVPGGHGTLLYVFQR
jgi:hypothetical protein